MYSSAASIRGSRRAREQPPQIRTTDDREKMSDGVLCLKDFGWCHGKLIERVRNRTRKIGGIQVNFVAEFDIDKGARTDLALEASEYDTYAFAEYESWMLLEPIATPAPAPAASGTCHSAARARPQGAADGTSARTRERRRHLSRSDTRPP